MQDQLKQQEIAVADAVSQMNMVGSALFYLKKAIDTAEPEEGWICSRMVSLMLDQQIEDLNRMMETLAEPFDGIESKPIEIE